MRILIVEDNHSLAETLSDVLSQKGYLTDVAHNGAEGLDNALSGIYDGIILDVMLPGINGFEVLEQLRSAGSPVPVLMLTALGTLQDRVKGLRTGADYYLTKPFENEELIACLEAILRRGGEAVTPEVLTFADLKLTPSSCTLQCGSRQITLNNKENEILRLLILNASQYLSKETILTKVWGYDSDAVENNVEAYISFLRKKLTLLRSAVSLTVQRRVGYRLEVKGND